jgi:hypothetical protein
MVLMVDHSFWGGETGVFVHWSYLFLLKTNPFFDTHCITVYTIAIPSQPNYSLGSSQRHSNLRFGERRSCAQAGLIDVLGAGLGLLMVGIG